MINRVEELHGVNVFFRLCMACVSCAVGMDKDSKGCACYWLSVALFL
jgi:hypothetical protein